MTSPTRSQQVALASLSPERTPDADKATTTYPETFAFFASLPDERDRRDETRESSKRRFRERLALLAAVYVLVVTSVIALFCLLRILTHRW